MINAKSIEENEMNAYLKSTNLTDWSNPQIIKLTKEIIGNSKSKEEKAIKIFYFVRDQIHFSICDSKTRATKILKKRVGECVTKTNFHIALLRAAGIHARFHRSKCKAEILKGIIPDWLFSGMPPIASHFWPEVYLSGKWIACEGILDKELYESLINLGFVAKEQIPTIDWNGENDLILFKPWIVEDLGTVDSYENVYEILDKTRKEEGMPPRIIEKLFGWIIYNSLKNHTDRLRNSQ